MEVYNIVSFSGIFILLLAAWFISRFLFGNMNRINWHLIGWGLGLQLLFALFIFMVPAGGILFQAINDLAVIVLSTASRGAGFVFGTLAEPPGAEGSIGFILAFQAFPTIIFFSALVAVLYYYNVLPFVIRQFARLFTRLMKISGAYALCGFAHVASMSIFVGGVTALVPGRTADVSKVAVKSLIAATFACLLTACVAGTFFSETSILLGSSS